MKKLLSLFCCMLYLHSISNTSVGKLIIPQQVTGEKTLVKALAAIVNREGKKKIPFRRVNVSLAESI